MSKANEFGVYEESVVHEVGRSGRSFAMVRVAQCDDGLWRFATEWQHALGGSSRPIWDGSAGYATEAEANGAGIAKLLDRWPKAWASDPESVHEDLRKMRAQIEMLVMQPSLF